MNGPTKECELAGPGSNIEDHAKDPVGFRRAITLKKGGHYLQCAVCNRDFDKVAYAEQHFEQRGHDEWLVRMKVLRRAGVYRSMDAEQS